jgi:hypothetical protein
MRQVPLRLRVVLAILIAMVAAGKGLPGIVEALRGVPAHVCTCASGGDHATCPVCNAPLTEDRQSLAPAARGVPCGDPRVAVGVSGEASTLPAPFLGLAPGAVWIRAPRPERVVIEPVITEPATPPPRTSTT